MGCARSFVLEVDEVAKKKVADCIAEWMADYGTENGYELSRTEFVKEGDSWYLRVYVDKLEGGGYTVMSTDDCEKISRFLSDKLDEYDPIEQNYYLEVSSPGLDRPLISEKDFVRFDGQEVEVKLYKAENGSKLHVGTLCGYDNGTVKIKDAKGNVKEFAPEQIAKVNLAVVF